MNPGDEQRAVREYKRLAQAHRFFRLSMHMSAGAAVLGVAAGFLIVSGGDSGAAGWLLVFSFGLHWAGHRAMSRGRALL